MGTLEALSLAMGTAWTSGINLYATVAALGIAGQMDMIQLPPNLQILMHPGVIAFACVMYVIEFFADKVPYVDSGWDVLHTFIRIPAGAVLAARSLGNLNPALELMALLAGGAVALAGVRGAMAEVRVRQAVWLGALLLLFGWSARILFQPLALELGLPVIQPDKIKNNEEFRAQLAALEPIARLDHFFDIQLENIPPPIFTGRPLTPTNKKS